MWKLGLSWAVRVNDQFLKHKTCTILMYVFCVHGLSLTLLMYVRVYSTIRFDLKL